MSAHMKYVLTFSMSIRIGMNVFECVGPFDTTDAAQAWYLENVRYLRADCKVLCQTMLLP